MKLLIILVFFITINLQYRLWFGDANNELIQSYERRLSELQQQVKTLKQQNIALYAEVKDLRKGEEALEERARYELGMIRENETFFQILE